MRRCPIGTVRQRLVGEDAAEPAVFNPRQVRHDSWKRLRKSGAKVAPRAASTIPASVFPVRFRAV